MIYNYSTSPPPRLLQPRINVSTTRRNRSASPEVIEALRSCATGARLVFDAGFAAARGAFFVTAGLVVICNPSVGVSMAQLNTMFKMVANSLFKTCCLN